MMPPRPDRCRSRPSGLQWLYALCLWLSGVSGELVAQPSSPVSRPAAATAGNGPTVEAPGDASAVPVQSSVTVSDNDIPPYHFSPLKITGRVDPDGRVAHLQADIEVNINHPAGWYDVPLRLTQGAVTRIEYEGLGEATPYQPAGQDDGIHWLFKGAGKHRLRLDLDVELRSTSTGTNLQLTLPSGSKFFPSQLSLAVPLAALTVEGGADVQTTPGTEGETLIESTFDGNRIDLTWRTLQQRRGTITRALTSIALDEVEGHFRVQAVQDLATDGQVAEVRVRLPGGFRLVSVGGRDYAGHRLAESAPGWVDVQLTPRERSDLQLDWRLESAAPISAGMLILDGFEVQGAVGQSGTVGIAGLPGHKLYRLSTEADDGIHREEPRRLRPTGSVSLYKWAWRFDRQPFELRLDLQEERPAFDARTRGVLTADADHMLLDLDFQVLVHAGRPRSFLLKWPAPGIDRWSLQRAPEGVVVTDATDETSRFLGELQRIELPAGREGEFTIPLQYQRPQSPGEFDVGLPVIVSERTLPAWLLVRGVDAVEPRLLAQAGLEPLVDSAADAWLREQSYESGRDQAYRLAEPQLPLTGQTNVYPRELRADTLVSVTRPTPDALEITQRIQLDVKYGRIEQLPLYWPSGFPAAARAAGAKAVECRLESGAPVVTSVVGDRLLLTPPDALQGRVPLLIVYRLPLDPAATQVDVPIFQSPEAPTATAVIAFPASGTLRVEPQGPGWSRIPTALQPSWMSTAPGDAFQAVLSREVVSAPQQYRVAAMFAQIQFDAAGGSRTHMDYELRSAPARVVLELPAGTSGVAARWQGSRLAELSAEAMPAGGLRVEIPLSADGLSNEGRLSVEYLSGPVRSLDSMSEIAVALPRLPEGVIVDESIVEISIPSDFSLLTYPSGLTPRFEWRPGLVFQRQPTAAYLDWRNGFLAAGSSESTTVRRTQGAGTAGNHNYAFWATGGTAELRFRAIGLWNLILLGSGLTLALAFCLWSIRAARSILTILLFGFVVALVGVFASEAVELLLQPVLLGLLAAMIAMSLQTQRPALPLGTRPRRDEHSTRSEHPRSAERAPSGGSSLGGVPTTQVGLREMQESGSRP